VAWAIASAGRAEQAQKDLASLKTDVTAQLRDMRDSLAKELSDMRQDMRSLPDQQAHIAGLERWTAQDDARVAALDGRLAALEKAILEIRADLTAVTQASKAKLPK
jgi:septal ring factor EnvC (AmiA/AmiB activator)